MDIRFECDCGHSVSTLTRGTAEMKTHYECEDCGRLYAITITQLSDPMG